MKRLAGVRGLTVCLVALAFTGGVLADEAAAPPPSGGAADPNAAGEPSVVGPTSKVKVEGKLPYIPTSNTIVTRLPVPLMWTPANVGIVNEPLIEEQDGQVLGDALQNVSGLNVQTESGVADYFLIRGFDSISSGLVLTDGASEPEVAFYQMYNVERVEVFKGPGGFLYGSNPMAGAVNIVRRQPVPGRFGRAGVSFGSFGTYDASVDYNLGAAAGKYAFRLNSAWRQSDQYRDDKDSRGYAVNPAFTWRLSDRTSLNANLEFAATDYQPDSGIPLVGDEVADVPRTRSYQSPFDTSDQTIGRGQVDFETRLNDTWSIRNKAYYRDLDWNSKGTLIVGVSPNFTGGLDVNRVLTLLDNQQRLVGDQLEGVLSASTGKVGHKVVVGVEASRYGNDFGLDVAFLPNIDLDDPHETATHPLAVDPNQRTTGDSRSLVWAPYAIDQMEFSDKWHAMAGVRYDRIDSRDTEVGTDRNDSELSPMGGVVYSPTRNLSFYANTGRSFSPPSPRLRFVSEPERAHQYEVGTKMDTLAGRLSVTVAAYRVERENIAITDANGFTQQAGDQRSRGVELEVAGEPYHGLRTFFSYAYNRAELTRFHEAVVVGFDPNTFTPIFGTANRDGNDPAFAPRHIANLWVSHRFDNGFGVGGGGRYVSRQFIDEDNVFAIDGYITVDAALFYTQGPWDLTLNLKNLTDREYETRGFGPNSVLPAAGFAAYGGVQRRF